MAEENNITGLTLNILWLVIFLMAMITGYALIVNNEGKGAIFDGYEEFEGFNLELSSSLPGNTENIANINANLSSTYNPELTISAAHQSGNAMGINMENLTIGNWNFISKFGGLIFGNIWTKTLSSLFASVLIFLSTLYMIRWIRRGD